MLIPVPFDPHGIRLYVSGYAAEELTALQGCISLHNRVPSEARVVCASTDKILKLCHNEIGSNG